MNKIALLQERATALRAALEAHQETNADAMRLLRTLTPLLNDIAKGKVVPPVHYEFRRALGREHPFYEPDSPFSELHAEFEAALEDWSSQPWYQELLKRTSHR